MTAKAPAGFSIAGPDIKITSGAVIALAMTLNELCTNTTKFGALSVPPGSVDIAWKIDEGKQRLQLTWSEKGGPSVLAPSRRSFGTRLIGSLGQQLKGEVRLAYEPSGFVYTLDVLRRPESGHSRWRPRANSDTPLSHNLAYFRQNVRAMIFKDARRLLSGARIAI
jgi:two-component sensor histidine kinase